MNCYNCNTSLSEAKVIARKNEIRFNCHNTRKQIVKCSKCNLIQLIPQWADKELDKIYENYQQRMDFVGQKFISKRLSKYLLRYLPRHRSILEVGCGSGDNVKYFRKLGYSIVGIDKDPKIEDPNNNIYFHDVYDKKIQAKYDFIYGLHVFEHMKDPVGFIERLRELSNDKATILLEFPSIEDPLLTVYKIKEFEKFYYRPDHHFFYTPYTIYSILYGFKIGNVKIKRVQNYGLINHLNWLIRKKPTNIKMNIPIIDHIYKFILTNIVKKSDTILLIIKKE